MYFFIQKTKAKIQRNSKRVQHERPSKDHLVRKIKKLMISTKTRIRVQNILNRIKNKQSVTLEERIFLNKLSSVSSVISKLVVSSLGPEASSIDND